jgi:hypothetical protein
MKIKQTIQGGLLGATLLLGFVVIPLASSNVANAASCAGVNTSIISCSQSGQGDDVRNSGVWGILIIALNIMLAGVGVLALAGIVWGAILYMSAGGSPEQTKKAMGIFTNVVIGLVAFAGMWALLNFLIPGGAFSNL